VYGARAAEAMKAHQARTASVGAQTAEVWIPSMTQLEVRTLAWRQAGLVRDGQGLSEAIATLEGAAMHSVSGASREDFILRNIHTVALLIARSALAREESRGGHYRTDFPAPRPEFALHSKVRLTQPVTFEN
jgi:L-aspartate oxidase